MSAPDAKDILSKITHHAHLRDKLDRFSEIDWNRLRALAPQQAAFLGSFYVHTPKQAAEALKDWQEIVAEHPTLSAKSTNDGDDRLSTAEWMRRRSEAIRTPSRNAPHAAPNKAEK